MKLKSMTLANFRGVQAFRLDVEKDVTEIHASNGIGKTTLMDAFTWCMTGYDSKGNADFPVKPQDANSRDIPHLDVTVRCEFDGATFERTLREVWTRKRGSATESFTGNTTDYSIDGLPVQKKEYDQRRDEFCKAELFKILSNPFYASENVQWKEFRRILIEVCGDVTDDDVLDSDAKRWEPITEEVRKHGYDKATELFRRQAKERNDRLEDIPMLIIEAKRGTQISAEKPAYTTADIAARKKLLTETLEFLTAAPEQAKKAARVAELRAMIETEKSAELTRKTAIQREQLRVKADSERACDEKRNQIKRAEDGIRAAVDRLTSFQREKEAVVKQATAFNLAQPFPEFSYPEYAEPEIETECPYCGTSPLPESKAEAIRLEHRAIYDKKRAAALETYNKDLGDYNNRRAEEQRRLTESAARIKAGMFEAQATIDQLTVTVNDVKTELKQMESAKGADPEAVETDPGSEKRIESYRTEIAGIEAGYETDAANDAEIAQTKADIAKLDAMTATLMEYDAAVKATETAKSRVAELEAELKTVGAAYEDAKSKQILCEDFIRMKVRLLDERVNRHFHEVRFKLLDENINGGLTECCSALILNPATGAYIEFKHANTAGQIFAGLDIIRTLQRHYNIVVPVWIDYAGEVVVPWPDMPGVQQIRLRAVEGVDKLTVI